MKKLNWKKPAMMVLVTVLAGQGAWEYSYRPGQFHPQRIVASDEISISERITSAEKKALSLEEQMNELNAKLVSDKEDISAILKVRKEVLPDLFNKKSEILNELTKLKEDAQEQLSEEDKKKMEALETKIAEVEREIIEYKDVVSDNILELSAIVTEREANKKEIDGLKETLCQQRNEMTNLVEKIEVLIEKQEKVMSYFDPSSMDFGMGLPNMGMNFMMPFSPFNMQMPSMLSMGGGMNSMDMTWGLFNMMNMQMNMRPQQSSINYAPVYNYNGMNNPNVSRSPSVDRSSDQYSLMFPNKAELSVPFIQPGTRHSITPETIDLSRGFVNPAASTTFAI